MPEWFGWLNTNWFAIVGPVLMFAAFWVGGLWLRRICYDAFRRWARRAEWKGRWLVIESTHGPFLQWAVLLGFHIAIQTSRLPPDSTIVTTKLTTSLFIFSLVWMLMRIGEGMLKLYLPHIRRYIARTKAPQPPAPLMFNGVRVVLVSLGLLALLNVWDAPDASGVLVLAAVVVVLAFVVRDALINMPRKIRMSHTSRKRSLRIGKFLLILLAIAGFVELTRRGYLVFAREESSNLDVMVLLLIIGLLTLVGSTLRSRRFRRVKPSFKAVLVPVVAVALVCAFAGIEPLASYKDTTVSVLGQSWHFVTSATRGDVATAVARAEPAVVRVETEHSGGSGMIIDKSGYVLTCDHVVGDSQAVTIVLMSGEQYEGSVIARDAATDIAIIRITGIIYGIPVIVLGDSDKVKAGEDVVAIGYSLGLEGRATISRGVVSAFRTSGGVDYVQTDAAINPGNSGGPLINLKGEVVGIANFKLVHETVEGMGFAVAVNEAKTFVVGAIAEDRAQQRAELEKQDLLALEREILRLINVEREQRGIPPVVWTQGMHSGARTHSQNMQARGYLYHDTGGMFAECCYGASHVSSIHATAQATVQAWMSSTTGHREILLDPQYAAGAVGVARDQGFWATYRCY
jgi:S1-C subfamily serine protease